MVESYLDWVFGSVHVSECKMSQFSRKNWNSRTCWHVMKSATHTQIPANPWAVFVCRKIPSAACNLSGSMSSAPLCVCSVVTLAIRFDCVGTVVEKVVVEMMAAVIVVDAVEFITLSGDDPDIISFAEWISAIRIGSLSSMRWKLAVCKITYLTLTHTLSLTLCLLLSFNLKIKSNTSQLLNWNELS